MIAAAPTVPERILLFCLASRTDSQAAGITRATAEHMMVRAYRRSFFAFLCIRWGLFSVQ